MLILKVIAFILTALFFVLLFKDKRSDLSVLIMLCAGIMVFIFCLTQLNEILEFLKEVSNKAGIDSVYLGIVLKILAIAYLASFTSEICRDAGAGSLVPITGFANSIVSPAIEFKSEGHIMGIGAKMFIIAGPVLVFGINASILYGLILWVFKLF